MSQCPPRDLNLNAYNSEEEVTLMPMTIRRALAWRQRKTADAGIRADTSVGATPAHGKTA